MTNVDNNGGYAIADFDKRAKLEHYATRALKEFVQIDVFLNGDEIMGRDTDGHSVCGGATRELMHGADVRILIQPDLPPAKVAELMRKALKAIEGGFFESIADRAQDCDLPF
jgi:hypothetical protein